MTYHLQTPDYLCSNCKRAFIPFKKDIRCPWCNEIENSSGEYYGFINELTYSMRVHKRMYGKYRPPAWLLSSYADYIQEYTYTTFDYLVSNPDKDIESAMKFLNFDDEKESCYVQKILCLVNEKDKKLSKNGSLRSFIKKCLNIILGRFSN